MAITLGVQPGQLLMISGHTKIRKTRSMAAFPFLDLPAELRIKIYRYLLLTKYNKFDKTYHRRGLRVRAFVIEIATLYHVCQLNHADNLQNNSLSLLYQRLLITTVFTLRSLVPIDKSTLKLPMSSTARICSSLLLVDTLNLAERWRISSSWPPAIMHATLNTHLWKCTSAPMSIATRSRSSLVKNSS